MDRGFVVLGGFLIGLIIGNTLFAYLTTEYVLPTREELIEICEEENLASFQKAAQEFTQHKPSEFETRRAVKRFCEDKVRDIQQMSMRSE